MSVYLPVLEKFTFLYGFELLVSFQPGGPPLAFLVELVSVAFVYLGMAYFLPHFWRIGLPDREFLVDGFFFLNQFYYIIWLTSGLQRLCPGSQRGTPLLVKYNFGGGHQINHCFQIAFSLPTCILLFLRQRLSGQAPYCCCDLPSRGSRSLTASDAQVECGVEWSEYRLHVYKSCAEMLE